MPREARLPRRLFVEPGALAGDVAVVSGADHRHLALVLRARPGEPFLLLDGQGGARVAHVTDVGRHETRMALGEAAPCPPEPAVHLTVAQALPKGDRFAEVVQHGTEAGASAFIPLLTERGVVRPDPGDADARRARWQAVAKGAAEQAIRGAVPAVGPVCALRDLLPAWGERCLLLHPGGVRAAEAIAVVAKAGGRACLAVGPEGGFSDAEVGMAVDLGASVVSVGPFVYRSETAAVAALAILLDRASDL